MGLAITIGPLAEAINCDPEWAEDIQEEVSELNKLLQSNGLKEHVEPEKLTVNNNRAGIDGFPYSFLHYLRRANAYKRQGKELEYTPTDGSDPCSDPVLGKNFDLFSHLNSHSDCEGYYVPQFFAEVLVDESESIPGAYVGSSQAMMRELIEVAPLIGISLNSDGSLPDEEAGIINTENETEEPPLWKERVVWLTLFEAARLSIENNALISFG